MDYKNLEQNSFFDIIILGGGPAGASAAIRLSRAGMNVALFEKEIFPRPHVGESLVPFCYELFEELGILNEMKQFMVRKPGVQFVNKQGTMATNFYFHNVLSGPNKFSFNVSRDRFDHIILNRAKAVGASIFENHKAVSVTIKEHERSSVTIQKPDRSKSTVYSSFILDATGQNAFLANKLKIKSNIKGLKKTAMVSHWNCSTTTPHFKHGMLHIVNLSQERNGWLWMVPVGRNRVGVGIVLDQTHIKKQRKRKTDDSGNYGIDQFYLDEVYKSPHAKKILDGSEQLNEVTVIGNFSYTISKEYGGNYALIGDAAGFIDPIFATGIYLALNLSKQVCGVISTRFNLEGSVNNLNLEPVFNKHNQVSKLLLRFIKHFYGSETINISELDPDLVKDEKEHKNKMIMFSVAHYLMAGDFYNESDKYLEYLDFLEKPKQIERFLHLAINRKDYNAELADLNYENVYPV